MPLLCWIVYENDFKVKNEKKNPHAGVAGDAYIECTHTLKLEGPDDVGGKLLGVGQRHAHHAVRLSPAWRPVLEKSVIVRGPIHNNLFSS
jgi:hypothetical protein